MDVYDDILSRYKNISNKLKKRFLKKPNVSEGSEQFASLARTLIHQECYQYAALCYLAQARCEHTLGNKCGEANSLTQAARAFLNAEYVNQDLKTPSFGEHLISAIGAYGHTIRVHIENKQTPLAANLCLELGDALMRLNKPDEAISHFQRSAELQFLNPLECLHALGKVSSAKIITKDYEGALSVLTEMSYMALEKAGSSFGRCLGAFSEVLCRCEVDRVLLLMLLHPSPQRIRPEHANTLEKYTWESSDDCFSQYYMDDELFILLQSLVMACLSKDIEALDEIQISLMNHLSTEQIDILQLVIDEIRHPCRK